MEPSEPVKGKGKAQGKSKDGIDSTPLTQEEALYRSALISNTKYDVSFALPKGDKYFGKVAISFDIKDLS